MTSGVSRLFSLLSSFRLVFPFSFLFFSFFFLFFFWRSLKKPQIHQLLLLLLLLFSLTEGHLSPEGGVHQGVEAQVRPAHLPQVPPVFQARRPQLPRPRLSPGSFPAARPQLPHQHFKCTRCLLSPFLLCECLSTHTRTHSLSQVWNSLDLIETLVELGADDLTEPLALQILTAPVRSSPELIVLAFCQIKVFLPAPFSSENPKQDSCLSSPRKLPNSLRRLSMAC